MNRLSEADRDLAPTRNEAASARARVVDLATSEGDYSAAEIEFMGAMQEYKRSSRRMFPTWSEVLEVVRGLGYEKASSY